MGNGLPTPMLSEMVDRAILTKARVVIADSDHALHITFFRLEGSVGACNVKGNDTAA